MYICVCVCVCVCVYNLLTSSQLVIFFDKPELIC